MLQLGILLSLHLLKLVLLAKLREVDLKVVIWGVDHLVVFVDSLLELFASDAEPDSPCDKVHALGNVGNQPNDRDLQDEHDSHDGKEDAEPDHVGLSHPVLVEVLGVVSYSCFIDA